MQFDMRSNLRAVERDLSDVARKQLPFATSVALNETATDLIKLNRKYMARVFDRPTRWTLNAFYFRRSSKRNLQIRIERKYAAARKDYLLRQIEGGARKQTGLERLLRNRLRDAGYGGYVLPTRHIRKNKFGNVSPAAVQRVLSGLKAQGDHHQNETKTTAARKRRSGAARYFTPKPRGKLSPGIYSRQGKKAPKKVYAFIAKAPKYTKRFKFYPNMTRATNKLFPRKFERALSHAVTTRRR